MGLFDSKSEMKSFYDVRVAKIHNIGMRSEQQDCFGIKMSDNEDNAVLAVVADGMGGLVKSDEVSQLVVKSMFDECPSSREASLKEELLARLSHTISAVSELVKDKCYDSGSTLVACKIKDDELSWISVGDSRVYLWRNGGIIQLSSDHDFRRELDIMTVMGKLTPEEVKQNPGREALTSYVGENFPRYIDFNSQPIKLISEDKILLASDGIYRTLKPEEIEECLESKVDKAAEIMEKKIQEKNVSHQDNYTAVILEIRS